jgi:integrase
MTVLSTGSLDGISTARLIRGLGGRLTAAICVDSAGLPFGSNPLTCPVRSLRAWLDVAAIASGPVVRGADRHTNISDARLTDQSAALIVKRLAKAAGLDPEKYAGHSLRSGLATAAAMADVSERAIMAQTGHKSLPMVRRYIRDGSLFRRNAAAAVGL